MHLLRFPTLEDMCCDVTRETSQFCAYLDRLFTSHYEKRAAGNVVHLRCTVVENHDVASEFVEWTLRLLEDRRFACKSYFREALQLVAEHKAEFRALHPDSRPANSDLLILVEKHRQVSKSASECKQQGARTISDWWATADDPVAMLLMMTFADHVPRKQLNSLRLFAAQCTAVDGIHPEFCEIVEKFAHESATETQLVALRREFRKVLTDYYANDYVKDPSYAVLVELGYRPLERICSPAIGWAELCDVAREVCATLVARRASSSQLAADLRKTVACPWSLTAVN